jgi:hypothetical protein
MCRTNARLCWPCRCRFAQWQTTSFPPARSARTDSYHSPVAVYCRPWALGIALHACTAARHKKHLTVQRVACAIARAVPMVVELASPRKLHMSSLPYCFFSRFCVCSVVCFAGVVPHLVLPTLLHLRLHAPRHLAADQPSERRAGARARSRRAMQRALPPFPARHGRRSIGAGCKLDTDHICVGTVHICVGTGHICACWRRRLGPRRGSAAAEGQVVLSPGADVASPGADVASPGADVASPGADVASPGADVHVVRCRRIMGSDVCAISRCIPTRTCAETRRRLGDELSTDGSESEKQDAPLRGKVLT